MLNFCLGICLSGTVDRLEGQEVVIELDGGTFTDFPRVRLTAPISEGERVHLHIQRHWLGPDLALSATPALLMVAGTPVTIPPRTGLQAGRTYRVHAHTHPQSTAPRAERRPR
jgi:hypothetical protein